jgi:hypothetical protein
MKLPPQASPPLCSQGSAHAHPRPAHPPPPPAPAPCTFVHQKGLIIPEGTPNEVTTVAEFQHLAWLADADPTLLHSVSPPAGAREGVCRRVAVGRPREGQGDHGGSHRSRAATSTLPGALGASLLPARQAARTDPGRRLGSQRHSTYTDIYC